MIWTASSYRTYLLICIKQVCSEIINYSPLPKSRKDDYLPLRWFHIFAGLRSITEETSHILGLYGFLFSEFMKSCTACICRTTNSRVQQESIPNWWLPPHCPGFFAKEKQNDDGFSFELQAQLTPLSPALTAWSEVDMLWWGGLYRCSSVRVYVRAGSLSHSFHPPWLMLNSPFRLYLIRVDFSSWLSSS